MWAELGIDPTGDVRAIKRAYARRLKQAHPEDDPEGFQRLRAAFEAALNYAAYYAQQDDDGESDAAQEAGAEPSPESEPAAAQPAPESIEHPWGGHALEGQSPDAQPVPAIKPHPWSELTSAEPSDAAPHAETEAAQTDATQQLHMRARALVAAIVDAIAQRKEAIALAHQRTAFGELIELDLAETFEYELAQAFDRLEWVPGMVLREAAERFAWHTDERRLTQLLPWASHVREQVRTLEVLRRITAASEEDSVEGRAKRLLLGPYNLPPFYWHALNTALLKEMRTLIASLEHGAPMLLQRYVDARTLAWWRSATSGPRLNGWHLLASFMASIFIVTRVPQWLPGSVLERVPLLAWFALLCLACYALQHPLARLRAGEDYRRWIPPDLSQRYFRAQLPAGLALMALSWLAYYFPLWIKVLLAAAFAAVVLPMVVTMVLHGALFGLTLLGGILTGVLANLMPGDERAHVWLHALCALWIVILVIHSETYTDHAPAWAQKLFDAQWFRRYYGWGIVAMTVLLALSGVLTGVALDAVGAVMFVAAVLYLSHGKAALRSLRGYGFILLGAAVAVLSGAMASTFPGAIRHVVLFALCLLLAIYTFVAALRKS